MQEKLKSALHIFLLLTAIVLIWRGIWGLADLYLFPKDETLSLFFSIIIGLIILFGSGKLYDLFDISP